MYITQSALIFQKIVIILLNSLYNDPCTIEIVIADFEYHDNTDKRFGLRYMIVRLVKTAIFYNKKLLKSFYLFRNISRFYQDRRILKTLLPCELTYTHSISTFAPLAASTSSCPRVSPCTPRYRAIVDSA